MSTEENVQVVKAFFEAIGSGDKQRLLELAADRGRMDLRYHREERQTGGHPGVH
jgi:ketosteroid isomerase-like protein